MCIFDTLIVQTANGSWIYVLTTQSSKIGTLKLGPRQSKNKLKSAVMDVASLCKCMPRP